ncbi:MAG: nitrogen specific signal transduction histidine kinase NtrB [Candidatus Rokubacteria bacterium CSP1-6]|nr:MAG: nitrogen specific signal transduction histidine kinase NtrB [Candidatus Rokubacteria bacterium CSP1-6]
MTSRSTEGPVGRHLAILRTVAAAVSRSLDFEEVLEKSLAALTEVTGHELASFHLLTPDGHSLILRGHRGLSPRLRDVNLTLPFGEGLIGHAAAQGRTLVVENVQVSPDLLPAARPVVEAEGIRGFVCVPIRARDRILGTLSLGRQTPDPFSDEEVTLLEAAADQIGLALDNARLYSELRRQLEELRRTQAELIHAEKLSAVGELAAGVAHEINNPLTTILGEIQLLLLSNLGKELKEHFQAISDETVRAARIVQSLLLFAGRYPPQRTLCAVTDQLQRVLDLKGYQLRTDDIRVVTEFEPASQVWADENQLQQVFLNLVQNAHQAMKETQDRGTLIARVRPLEAGVRVEVLDDGPGISPEHLPRLFDPFFTTKPPGVGTGLGLSVSYRIVTEHGGRLWAENRPEGGAAFILELPVGVPPAEPGAAPTLPHKALKVLVVEDEAGVAGVLRGLLRRLGHEAEVARDGRAALARVEKASFDLLIVDLKMPGMSGRQLWEALRECRSPLAHRMAFMSGNARSPELLELVKEAGALTLPKPFTLDDVSALLRHAASRPT